MSKSRAAHSPKADPDLLYGRQAVREALRAGRRRVHQLYLAQGIEPHEALDEIRSRAQKLGAASAWVDRQQLDSWLSGVNHQGVALRVGAYPYAELDDVLALARQRDEPPLVLLLDRVQDPQNLGSLLRTAEACGVHGVVVPQHRAAGVTPAVVNASAGAVEHLLVCRETNLVNTIDWLKRAGLWIAGLEARPDAQPFDAVDLNGPLGIVVGSEGAGVGRLVAEHCDWLLQLPMVGRINSLNVAVAGSVLLFFARQQRGKR